MSVLFLLEVAKKTDHAFQLTPQSSAHTVLNAKADIEKMVKHLLDKKTTADSGRTSPAFSDPIEAGWKILSTTSWLHDKLSSHLEEEIDPQVEEGELDLN